MATSLIGLILSLCLWTPGTLVFIILIFAPNASINQALPELHPISLAFQCSSKPKSQKEWHFSLLLYCKRTTLIQAEQVSGWDGGWSRRWKKCNAARGACSAAPQPLCYFLTPSETLPELLRQQDSHPTARKIPLITAGHHEPVTPLPKPARRREQVRG